MNDEHTLGVLRHAMATETRGHYLDPAVAGTAWSEAHATRPHRARAMVAVAASVIAVAGVATAFAVTRGGETVTPPAGSSACSGNISSAALPTWARTGFSPGGVHTPHVFGADRAIVAILFVPLQARQPSGTNNKILWVAQDGGGPLHITARLEGSRLRATRTLDLGPSILDLPEAGCWRLRLAWSGHRDTVSLRYR